MGKQFDTTNKDSMDELIEYSKELSKKQSKAADKYLKKEREKAAASSIPKLLDIANPNKFDIIQPYPRDVDELIKWTISSIETDFYIMNVYSLREKYRRYANIKDHWPIMLENVHPDWLKLKNAIISASNYIISELPCLEVEFFNRKKKAFQRGTPPP